MKKIGFHIQERRADTNIMSAQNAPKVAERPVCSLVSIRFAKSNRTLTYYNDKFDLEVGDHVFVSGRLAGQLGIVEKVTTKFKINLADYQRVISKADRSIHGTYRSVLDKMVSYDQDAMTPEAFRTWILPPAHLLEEENEKKEEIIVGEGYELDLSHLEDNDEVDPSVLQRAVE